MLEYEPTGQRGRMAIRNGRNGNIAIPCAAFFEFAWWLHY